jgi:prepilin signal peptidase PulO-like enzyme (type II secretory pathway)
VEIIYYIAGIILSASVASFSVTLADRILLYFYGNLRKKFTYKEKWKLILNKRSHCFSCDIPISITYLLPIFGFLFTKGRCKHCNAKLDLTFPITEIVFALLFIFLFYITNNFYFSISSICLFGNILITMITDLKKYFLDYENLFFITPLGLLSNYFYNFSYPDIETLYVFIGFLLIFGGLHFLYKKGMGFGDVVFAPVLGAIIGHPYWMIFINTATVGAVAGAFAIKFISKNKNWKQIPMGFYMGIGFISAFICKVYLLTP